MNGVSRVQVERALTPDEASQLVGSTVPELDGGTRLITAPTILSCEGEPVAAYLPLADAGRLRRAALAIDCSGGVQRNTNYRSRSRTFGYAPPRIVTRRESCSLTALGRDQPDVEAVLDAYADQFSAMLKDIDPEIIPRDQATLGEILPDWRLGEAGLWTSGVVNDTAALPYHRDGFNFATWSAMPVLRRGVRGGYLHLPEFGVALACADSTVTLFPGKRWVHGVTPLTRVRKGDGYRISIVYYALRGMKDCRTAAEETRKAQLKRTEREAAMAQRIAAGDTTIPGKSPDYYTTGARQPMAGWRRTGYGDADHNSMGPRR
jgi:hypothetical protein